MQLVVAILWAAGCSGSSAPEERPASSATPWVFTDTGADAAFDAATAEADLGTLLTSMSEVQPEPLLASYGAARAYGDEDCPPEESLDSDAGLLTWWYGACQIEETGTTFNGVMTAWQWKGLDLSTQSITDLNGAFPPGYSWTGVGFDGRIDVFDAAATFDFSCSCEVVIADGVAEDGGTTRVTLTRGPASWTGEEATGTWIDVPGQLVRLQTQSTVNTDGMTSVSVLATLSGPGERYRALTIELNASFDAGVDDRCAQASGTLGLRDSWTGATHEAGFDASGEGCTICSDLEGSTVCADALPLLRTARGVAG